MPPGSRPSEVNLGKPTTRPELTVRVCPLEMAPSWTGRWNYLPPHVSHRHVPPTWPQTLSKSTCLWEQYMKYEMLLRKFFYTSRYNKKHNSIDKIFERLQEQSWSWGPRWLWRGLFLLWKLPEVAQPRGLRGGGRECTGVLNIMKEGSRTGRDEVS